MAPEAAVLKRKRTRPSDFWIVNAPPIAPDSVQTGQAPKEKRRRVSQGVVEQSNNEGSAAVDLGLKSRSVAKTTTEDASVGDKGVMKLLRRRRTSDSKVRLEVMVNSKPDGEIQGANNRKRTHLAHKARHEDLPPALSERNLNTETLLVNTDVKIHLEKPKKRTKPAAADSMDELGIDPVNYTGEGRSSRGQRGKGLLRNDPNTSGTNNGASSHLTEAGPIVKSQKRTQNYEIDDADSAAAAYNLKLGGRMWDTGQKYTQTDQPGVTKSFSKSFDRRRSGRLSNTVDVETATSSFAKSRAAPKKIHNAAGTARAEAKQQSSAAEVSQPRGSQVRRASEPTSRRNGGKANSHPPELKPRHTQRESDDETAHQTDNAPTYQHLAPIVRRVPRQKIEASWESLAPAGVERISKLVNDVQKPVMALFIDEKRTEANTALQMISRKLISKVSRGMPFPPPLRNSREDDFDFEKILDNNRGLEAQLTEALGANEQLESKLAEERNYLQAEEMSFLDLESNAKSELTMRKDAGRKQHLLLQCDAITYENTTKNDLGLEDKLHSNLPFTHTDNENLQDIAQQLVHHLGSIQDNIGRVHGVSEAMAQSGAAVQATLFEHLRGSDYMDIVLR